MIPDIFTEDVNLILAHGRRRSNERFQKLMHRATLRREYATEPHEHEAQVVCGRWFLSRKRALLGQFGVGTVDQAMQAAMRLRHQFVRAFGLGLSVVIIDEVHAYDVYMETILERLIEWLGSLGTPVVLLSATLPQDRRRDLIAAYLKGCEVRPGHKPAGPAVLRSDSDAAPYPLVTLASAEGVQELGLEAELPSISVGIQLVKARAEERSTAVLETLLKAAAAGSSVCVVPARAGMSRSTTS